MALRYIEMKRLKAKGIEGVGYEPTLKEENFFSSRVVGDFDEFKSMCDVIVSNRLSEYLYDIEDKDFYTCGPSEFLYLFNHAELILTDSFHAYVFSMIFNKSFYVFDRNTKGIKCMNSRFDTLLTTFKQEQRKVT